MTITLLQNMNAEIFKERKKPRSGNNNYLTSLPHSPALP